MGTENWFSLPWVGRRLVGVDRFGWVCWLFYAVLTRLTRVGYGAWDIGMDKLCYCLAMRTCVVLAMQSASSGAQALVLDILGNGNRP